MTKNDPFRMEKIPLSRIATFDICSIANTRHYVSALLEFDVTEARTKLRAVRNNDRSVSFSAWLLKCISTTLIAHPTIASFLYNNKKIMLFDDCAISFIIEKEIEGKKVPIPLLIEHCGSKSISDITQQIDNAKSKTLNGTDIVLHKKTQKYERLYSFLPTWMRHLFWKYLFAHPRKAYATMGNVSVTFLGTSGRLNGWFIHKTIHPVSFGVGSIVKKPVVRHDTVVIRDILNMTILFDHDVADGAPIARFIRELTSRIENGEGIDTE